MEELKQVGDLRIATEDDNPFAVRKIGKLIHYVQKKGTNVSHAVFSNAAILDRVNGFGLQEIKDMEFISEAQHQKNIGIVTAEGKSTVLAKANAGPDADAVKEDPFPEDWQKLTKKKLLALVTLQDLDVDLKGTKVQLIERIEACREGKPAPTA